MGILERIKNHDWFITVVLIILGLLSISLIFATTFNAGNSQQGEGTAFKQIIFLLVGFAIYFLLMGVDLSWLKQKGVVWGLYLFILLTLIYLVAFGEVREATQRWILLGPFSFQPAEFAKLVLVVVTSYIFTTGVYELDPKKAYLDSRSLSLKTPNRQKFWHQELFKKIFISFVSLIIYVILVYLQPALGNSLITIAIWALMLYMVLPISTRTIATIFVGALALLSYYQIGPFEQISNASFLEVNSWKIFTMIALAILLVSFKFALRVSSIVLSLVFTTVVALAPIAEWSWNNLLREYQRARVTVFFNPASVENAEQTIGYQVRQSLIAIGSGQINGTGYLQGSQSTLQNLPFAHTDFIFAALAEQFGFIGVVVLFGLYVFLIWRMILIFLNTKDRFGKLVIIGVISILLINIFVNTAMNLGLIPVTGVTLPMMSYGGSSIMVIMASIALVQIVKISTRSTEHSEKFGWRLN